MKDRIRILIAEDEPADAALAEREIKKSIKNVLFYRVETEEAFRKALVEFMPDLIVSDYQMPAFDGMRALLITLKDAPHIPLIIHTGSMNEDTAVACMKAGAADYVIKEHIKRLAPAIERAFELKKIKQEHLRAQRDLVVSEDRFRMLAENASDLIYRYEYVPERKFTYVSNSATKITGYTPEEHYADPDLGMKLVHPMDRGILQDISAGKRDPEKPVVFRWIKKSGEILWTEQRNTPVYDDDGNLVALEGISRDITDRILAEEALEKERTILRTVIDSVPDSIYVKDLEGRKLLSNKANWSREGFKREEEIIGKTDFDIWPADVVQSMFEDDQQVLKHGKGIVNREEKILDSKGETVWLLTSKLPLRDQEGSITGLVGIGRDITEIKKAHVELVSAKEKAEESDRLKSAFLANMSHEIRTPMNGILGFAELLKAPGLTGDEQQEYIRIIERSGARMLNIINQIVDISKIEAGLMELNIGEVNVNEQIDEICTFFGPQVEEKGMQCSCKKGLPDEKAVIRTDQVKLHGVMANLVKNAIKFSSSGAIEFGYEQKGGNLEFYVGDSGIGIQKDRLDAIFERFVQAEIEDRQAKQGAGLGLAITKAYVEMLGGKIRVESEVGKGSTFYFTLPVIRGKDGARDPGTDASRIVSDGNAKSEKMTNDRVDSRHPSGEKKLKVLIAEDDSISEMVISKLVSSFSRETLIARNGVESVELFQGHPDIDLILMDIQMPEMNGYEATEKIRETSRDVIIIAQTAFSLSGDREKAIASGCNDYLAKPIKKELLSEMICKYFPSNAST